MDGIKGILTPPDADEVEITLIGGTAGYGESVVVHLGNGVWAVVDSCVNAFNGDCAPLSYLKEFYKEEEVANHLKYVVCTHWHEDHIKGMTKLIDACSRQAVFVLSCADDREKYIYEMLEGCEYTGSSRKLKELSDSMDLANRKSISIKRVEQDKMIFNIEGVQCFALSPSPQEIEKFEQEIANALLTYHKSLVQISQLKTIDPAKIEDAEDIEGSVIEKFAGLISEKIDEEPISSEKVDNLLSYKDAHGVEPNERCVAMLLSFNGHHVILGADLEYDESKSPESGWQSVANCDCLHDVEANLFKIPHHGSHTGYYKYFIDKYIKSDAVSKLSSWYLGGYTLPKHDMLVRYFGHSKNLYITTTSLLGKKNKEKDKTIRGIMNDTTEEIHEFKPTLGIIRSRMKKTAIEDMWQTVCFGSAQKIEKEYLDSIND